MSALSTTSLLYSLSLLILISGIDRLRLHIVDGLYLLAGRKICQTEIEVLGVPTVNVVTQAQRSFSFVNSSFSPCTKGAID